MKTQAGRQYAADLFTANCIACLEPAVRWGGHVDMSVLDHNLPVVQITAGWCKDCQGVKPVKPERLGWYGNWIPEYGLSVEGVVIDDHKCSGK